MGENPLVNDRNVDFVLYEVLDAERLCALPAFAEHSREVFDLYLEATRKLARQHLFPTYKAMDEAPPKLVDGRIVVHPAMHDLYPRLVELGLLTATRPPEVGGAQLPLTVANLAVLYPMAANLSALGFAGLTTGAAHLIESFADQALRDELMTPMYEGRWTGTMALTEPQAGSSLADITTTATPTEHGHYLVRGSKIFISGGDQDFCDNVVHMTLARIEGDPAGLKGVSLFAVPRLRVAADGGLEDNDVATAQKIHKAGWRGLPSLALNYGERGDCRGWLVGEPGQGLRYMFQMMNEARLMVGSNGVATASAAYHASVAYALERTQGRPLGDKDPTRPAVPIFEHAEIRRLLLRQKAIVEGGLCLIGRAARYADLSAHAEDQTTKKRAFGLLDLLTPIAKSFPAEWGFESNALALQVHGGYGYSTEYLPEAWLRDQKLNSIHEGTTQIQGLDLLGRKVMAGGGAALQALLEDVKTDAEAATAAGVDPIHRERMVALGQRIADLTMELGKKGLQGKVAAMLLHSGSYLELMSIYVIAWQWLSMAGVAQAALGTDVPEADQAFYRGKLRACDYWFSAELSRVPALLELCASGDAPFEGLSPAEL